MLVAAATPALAAPPVPSTGHIEQIPSSGQPRASTTSLKSWFEAFFVVNVGSHSGEQVVQVEVSRVQDGATVNLFPYWQNQWRVSAAQSGAAVEIRSAPWSFQAGYDYTWRVRSWSPGEAPGAWSSTGSFSVQAVLDKPTPPYPMFPRRDVPAADNILRADSSALPAADTGLADRDIASYVFEVKTETSTDVLWESDPVPAPAAGGIAQVAVPNILDADSSYRWRVYAIDDGDRLGNPSRWRYFNTTGPQWKQTWDFIPDRAGSYDLGLAAADEASGLTASSTYTDV
ncbi:MAG: hypothetical protein ACE367_15565 [Acidimicrobiales bacterium]